MTDRTDAELLQAAESEAAAFAELYRRHASTVHGWFRRRLEWAASDLTAETFAQAWLSRRSFRDEADGSALPWLLGIARNVARESARRNDVETRRSRIGCRRGRRSLRRSSSASSTSCRTRTSRQGSASGRPRRDCVSRGRSGAFPPCP